MRRPRHERSDASKQDPPDDGGAGVALFVMTVAVAVVAMAVGYGVGLGSASVLTALIGVFCVIGSLGGALRPDLRRMAVLGPLILVAACVPRLLATWNDVAGIAAVVVVIFSLSLMPAVSHRLRVSTIGASYATIAGYSKVLPPGTRETDIVLAVALGLVIAVAVRVLVGIGDPSKHTREQLSQPFVSAEVDRVDVIRSCMIDAPCSWTTAVLESGLRYRRAVGELSAMAAHRDTPVALAGAIHVALGELDHRAHHVAALITARRPDSEADAESTSPVTGPPALNTEALTIVGEARAQLEAAQIAARQRDRTPERSARAARRAYMRARVVVACSPGSGTISVATAKAVGVFAAWGTGLQLSAPMLGNTYLNAIVSMLQPTFAETTRRVLYRVVGCIAAAGLVLAVAAWLPPGAIVVIALGGLFVLTSTLFTRPIVSNAGGVAMTVAMTVQTAHLDPFQTLGHLVVMIGSAALIVLLVSVPQMIRGRRSSATAALDGAVQGVDELLGEMSSIELSNAAARFELYVRGMEMGKRLRESAQVMPGPQLETLTQAAAAIDLIVVLAVIDSDPHAGPESSPDSIGWARDILCRRRSADDLGDSGDDRLAACAREVDRCRAQLAAISTS